MSQLSSACTKRLPIPSKLALFADPSSQPVYWTSRGDKTCVSRRRGVFNHIAMATGFVGSTKNFPFSFDNDVEEDETGRNTPHLNKRIGESNVLFRYLRGRY